jgi:hypothetical protein
VATVEIRQGKRTRSTNIGSSLRELVINATKTLGSGYGFVSLYKDKIVSVSLSSNFSAIEKATNKNISKALLYHMRENAMVHEKSVLESVIDVLRPSR